MTGSDRGLNLVRPRLSSPQSAFDQGRAFGDLGVVPAGAVLILQKNEVAGVIDAAGSASIHEEQQREKAADLRFLRQKIGQCPSEADRLLAQFQPHELVAARRAVTLREHQVDDPQDRGEPFGQRIGRRHAKGDASLPDLALRPH